MQVLGEAVLLLQPDRTKNDFRIDVGDRVQVNGTASERIMFAKILSTMLLAYDRVLAAPFKQLSRVFMSAWNIVENRPV